MFSLKGWHRAALAAILLAAGGFVWLTRPGVMVSEPPRDVYPERGLDLSAHNGEVDFEAVREDGYSFVILKATEGTDFKDRSFTENYRKARAAGLKVGAYHFFRFDKPGYMQAVNVIHSLRGKTLDLPIALDVEEWGNPSGHTTSQIMERLRSLIHQLEAHGYDVIIYSNKDGFRRFIEGRLDHYPTWICDMSGEPVHRRWRIWQYTHRGSAAGVSGKVDVNVMNPRISGE